MNFQIPVGPESKVPHLIIGKRILKLNYVHF